MIKREKERKEMDEPTNQSMGKANKSQGMLDRSIGSIDY